MIGRLIAASAQNIVPVLIATAFLLYYSGSDTLRPWISNGHLVVGLALPVLLLLHVVVGRRGRDKA